MHSYSNAHTNRPELACLILESTPDVASPQCHREVLSSRLLGRCVVLSGICGESPRMKSAPNHRLPISRRTPAQSIVSPGPSRISNTAQCCGGCDTGPLAPLPCHHIYVILQMARGGLANIPGLPKVRPLSLPLP